MLRTFTTRAANRAERSRQWQAISQSERIEFADDREASLRGGEFGSLNLCRISMGRHRAVQSTSAAQSPIAPSLKFLFQEEGQSTVSQGGLSHQIRSGQWCALRTDIAFVITAPMHARQLVITMPCMMLPDIRKGLEWWRQPRNFQQGPAQILHACAAASVIAGSDLSPADRAIIGGQLVNLVEMTLRADIPASAPDLRHERRQAIMDYIDAHLGDSDLGVARISRAFNLSSRTLHKLFEGEALTVARLIWDRRLERCRDEMIDPALSARSITEIAHLWGFSDSQHFSRAFKLRFGLTPRDYRNLHAASNPQAMN